MRLILIVQFVFLSLIVNAQPSLKSKGKVNGRSYMYYVMRPEQTAKGLVLLMPSRGESPKKLFWHTPIPRHLAAHGFITVVPEVGYSLTLQDATRKILDDLIENELTKARMPNAFLLIGGFSSGGAIAASYAEYKLSKDKKSVGGVFLIDPPLDLERFYNAWVPLISSECPKVIIDEGKFIKRYLEQLTGGSPTEARNNYLKYAPFIASDSSGGNARFLKTVAIRLYTEPDLSAMKQRYCKDLSYQNLNSSDLDALNDYLIKLGNSKVEYIRTSGRGLHSWNIVDPEELAKWADNIH